MQFNSEANSQDCVSEILKICGTSTTNYPLNDITRRFNFALDWYFSLAFLNGKNWNFDDINETSPPIDTQNIVSGTNRYKVGDFTEKVIGLIRVEILNSNGKGRFLDVDDMNVLKANNLVRESGRINSVGENTFQEKYVNAASGTPSSYIKYGDFIYLDKKPDYNYTNGLLIYFNRPAAYFTPSDTTKVPGVPSIHHMHLCQYAAIPYLLENGIISEAVARSRIAVMEEKISSYFGQIRAADKKPRLSVRQEDCR